MLNDHVREAEQMPTEAEIQAMVRSIDDKVLAMTCAQQREEPVGPYLLREQASALDCYAPVMIDWLPGREWFARNTPRLFAAARLMRRDPRLAVAMARNRLAVD